MQDDELITRHFEEQRPQLRAVAYRMLGSVTEADDAVQDAWLRLQRTDTSGVDNLGAWLTTVVSRVCLNVLRARAVRRAEPLDEVVDRLPDMVVSFDTAGPHDTAGPDDAAVLADSVGLALLVVLDSLGPAERLAFVLHDMFGVPFDEIAPILDRSEAATRQLASRARRRVRGAAPTPDRDLVRQREVVDAFFAAARGGDFDRLVAVLHPDAVVRADAGPGEGPPLVVRGAAAVASRASHFADPARVVVPALVNGGAGVVITLSGTVVSVMASRWSTAGSSRSTPSPIPNAWRPYRRRFLAVGPPRGDAASWSRPGGRDHEVDREGRCRSGAGEPVVEAGLGEAGAIARDEAALVEDGAEVAGLGVGDDLRGGRDGR